MRVLTISTASTVFAILMSRLKAAWFLKPSSLAACLRSLMACSNKTTFSGLREL